MAENYIKYKTFVINMKKNPDRLLFMTNQMRELSITFDIQEGIDGQDIHFERMYGHYFNDDLSRKDMGQKLRLGEKGCALSHMKVLEKAIEEDLDYVLILEDDVELHQDFKKTIERVLKDRHHNKSKWDYLSFNYPTPGLHNIRLWLFLISIMYSESNQKRNFIINTPIYFLKFLITVSFSLFEGAREYFCLKRKGGHIFTSYRPLYLAGCYLVSRVGIKKLLSVSQEIIYAADRLQNIAKKKSGLKLCVYVPLLAKQRRDKFDSTMFENKEIAKKYFFNN